MDSKENMPNRLMKRKSSCINDKAIKVLRPSHSSNDSSNDNLNNKFMLDSITENPMIITSSNLTGQFKVTCNLNISNICSAPSMNSSMIEDVVNFSNSDSYVYGTPEEQIIPLSNFSDLPISTINSSNYENRNSFINNSRTPEDQIIPLSDFHNIPNLDYDSADVSDNCILFNIGTPEEQIIPLSEFKYLPVPELELVNSAKFSSESNFALNKSICESYEAPVISTLDDSFENIKFNLMKSQSYTPASFNFNPTFLTPETPCDINFIDMNSQLSTLHQLPRINQVSRIKKNKHMAASTISPMFYDNIPKPRKSKIRRTRTEIDSSDVPCPFMEDNNKVEEVTANSVNDLINIDFACDGFMYHIVDCRYPYEYDGGHINGAVNLYTPYQMLSYIFLNNYDLEELQKPLENPEEELRSLLKEIQDIKIPDSAWKGQAYIFHCEFSSIRGPEMARCLRNVDRFININYYPKLFFPKVQIMKKGYKEFYRLFKDNCKPCNYVKMDIKDPNHKNDESCLDELDDLIAEKPVSKDIDELTRQSQIREYNACKKESQEQMKLLSLLISGE